MSQFSKTWWGQRFLEALESFTDSGRLSRGRSYAGDHRIKQWEIDKGQVKAKVRGNKNPYFGVYQEPTYRASIKMKTIPAAQWKSVMQVLSSRASFIARLMADEMPETIEEAFMDSKFPLLPQNAGDFTVSCSCPDYAVPCKHIAGVCYRLASLLDRDPFLLFELRGLSRDKLHQALAKSPLGKILSTTLSDANEAPPAAESFYTRPRPVKRLETVDPKNFWTGDQPLPKEIEPANPSAIAALLVKKGGDYPPFWDQQKSFITLMEAFYDRVRKGSQRWL